MPIFQFLIGISVTFLCSMSVLPVRNVLLLHTVHLIMLFVWTLIYLEPKLFLFILFYNSYSFQPHYGPGVDSASNRNGYQESSQLYGPPRPVKARPHYSCSCSCDSLCSRVMWTIWQVTRQAICAARPTACCQYLKGVSLASYWSSVDEDLRTQVKARRVSRRA
jgi:hypothetical protein